jgi:hypothetical protein
VVDKDKLDTDVTKARATQLTKRIKDSHVNTWKLLAEAAKGRAWKALGYKNWNEWRDKEFSDLPILPRDKRKEAVASLAKDGLSVRAISDITGASKSQVDRDRAAALGLSQPTVPNGTVKKDDNVIDIPASDITEVPDGGGGESGEGASDPEPTPTIGRDGRVTDTTNIGKTPTVINVVSVARTIANELANVRIRLDSLFAREDYEENKVDVQGTLETAVGDIIDTLVEEFADLISERMPEPEPAGA